MSDEKKSWRDIYQIHPAALLFPRLPEDELRALGEDIKQNGLREPITLWSMEPAGPWQVLDGINRLDAMELVGMETLEQVGNEWRLTLKPRYFSWVKDPYFPTQGEINPYLFVVSANVHRRHMTKELRAELIVRAVELERTSPPLARSVKQANSHGYFHGSSIDPFKAKVVEEAAKHGISKRTIERAIAKDRGPVFERERSVDPLDEFDVRKVIRQIVGMLEPASEIEIRQVLSAIRGKLKKHPWAHEAAQDRLRDAIEYEHFNVPGAADWNEFVAWLEETASNYRGRVIEWEQGTCADTGKSIFTVK
jgi:hypothetical protein